MELPFIYFPKKLNKDERKRILDFILKDVNPKNICQSIKQRVVTNGVSRVKPTKQKLKHKGKRGQSTQVVTKRNKHGLRTRNKSKKGKKH